MPGIQRFLTNDNNEVASATVAASSTKTASNTVFATTPSRADKSTGTVALSGAFTDTADATIDIEITGTGGTTARVSDPVFAGAGNGTMTGVSATSGVSSQTITATLVSLGTTDAKAVLELFGNKFRSQRTGQGGNNLRITANTTGLTYTATNNTTLAAISAGTERFVGEQWDFGALDLTAGGNLSDSTLRIAFGTDPQVYRQYHTTESGQDVYYFDPPIVRDVLNGTTVKTVTGTYSVTVDVNASAWAASTAYTKGQWIVDSNKVYECTTAGTSGGSSPTFNDTTIGDTTTDNTVTWTYIFASDTETHSSLTTLYDLFVALLQSAFVEPADDAVIVEDKTPGGMAVDDMPLRTSPYHLGYRGTGSSYVTDNFTFDTVDVSNATATEDVEIECTANTIVGAETWSVKGSRSGTLAAAVTAVLYSQSGISFTIPTKTPTGAPIEASGEGPQITAKTFAADDGTTATFPKPCIHSYRYGSSLANKTFTFIYKRRPSDDCDCDDVDIDGNGPLEDCLGVEVQQDMASLTDTSFLYRQSRLNEWYTDKVESNTVLGATRAHTASNDIELARLAYNEFITALRDVHTDTNAVIDSGLSAWAASTAYTLNDEILDDTDKVFRVTSAGTSGGSEPTWVTTDYGSTTTDSGVTWTYVRKAPLLLWDTYLTNLETAIDDLDDLADYEIESWIASTNYNLMGGTVVPTTPNGFIYRITGRTAGSASVSGASEPTWPTTVGNNVTDNEIIWTCAVAASGDDLKGSGTTVINYAKRYTAQMNEVRIAAALSPGKSNAGGGIEPSPCWQDDPDATFYWEVNGGEYLPMFTNQDWHSAKEVYNQDTGARTVEATKEIYLAIAIGCSGSLQAGDTFTVTVSDVSENKTYQVGDKITLTIVAATARQWQDGVSGDNLHTWAVRGSVAGALADYSVEHSNESAYSNSGVGFLITRGDQPNSIGDTWTFTVSREQYRWRKNSGSWSSAADIPTTATLITDGLSATFTPGAGTSFEANDLFAFTVKQPYAPAHSQLPTWEYWQANSATADITYTFASDQSIDAIAIMWHGLPSGTGITLELLDVSDVVQYTATPSWSAGVILDVPSSTQTARKLRISLTSATDGWIAWAWCGVANSLSIDAERCRVFRSRQLARATGDNAGAIHLGQGYTGELTYSTESRTTGGVSQTDLDYLDTLFASLKSSGDYPFGLIPNANRSSAVGYLFKWDADDFDPVDLWEYGFADTSLDEQEYQVTIPLGAVYV